jgi:ATP adenylyltransferase
MESSTLKALNTFLLKPAASRFRCLPPLASPTDETHHVIARDRTCFALLNTYPYTGGHLMVVPYKQTPDFNELTDEEISDLMKLTRRCQNALIKVMKPDGFNIGLNLGKVAGAGIVEHLHIHVVPRWNGDTN